MVSCACRPSVCVLWRRLCVEICLPFSWVNTGSGVAGAYGRYAPDALQTHQTVFPAGPCFTLTSVVSASRWPSVLSSRCGPLGWLWRGISLWPQSPFPHVYWCAASCHVLIFPSACVRWGICWDCLWAFFCWIVCFLLVEFWDIFIKTSTRNVLCRYFLPDAGLSVHSPKYPPQNRGLNRDGVWGISCFFCGLRFLVMDLDRKILSSRSFMVLHLSVGAMTHLGLIFA